MLSEILHKMSYFIIVLSILKVWVICWLLFIFGSFVAWYWSWIGLIGVSLIWSIYDTAKGSSKSQRHAATTQK